MIQVNIFLLKCVYNALCIQMKGVSMRLSPN